MCYVLCCYASVVMSVFVIIRNVEKQYWLRPASLTVLTQEWLISSAESGVTHGSAGEIPRYLEPVPGVVRTLSVESDHMTWILASDWSWVLSGLWHWDQPLPWHHPGQGRPTRHAQLRSYRLLKYFTFQLRLSSQIAAPGPSSVSAIFTEFESQ